MSSSPLKIVAAVSLALLLPSAAEAAKKRTHRPHVAAHHATRIPTAAYRPAAASPQTVVFGDRVIGADPDPRIRHELLRDLGAVFGGAD